MLGTASSRSTRQLKQLPESKSSISLWQSVFSLEHRESLLLLYKLSTQLKIFCWHKRVFVCVRVCVFVYVCWGGTDRNLGGWSCHNEMSIFMTCCLLSGMCELFLLQTSASDIWTFTDSRTMCETRKTCKFRLIIDIYFIFLSACSVWRTSSVTEIIIKR